MGNAYSGVQGVEPPVAKTSVSFDLNGKTVVVQDVSPSTTLNDWLRTRAGFTGTKRMCGEGGCGCCVVAATISSQIDDSWDCVLTEQDLTIAINSCLCPLYSVDGWSITTVEGIGSSSDGYHPIQLRLADYNGTQCGYCTPGFVMSMYSLLQNSPHPTKQQVEDTFDGNICRCTGYRSILDAMKSFAVDSSVQEQQQQQPYIDIEDLGKKNICTRTGKVCIGSSSSCQISRELESSPAWYSPTSMAQLAALFSANSSSTFQFVAGGTGKGVYKDVSQVQILVSLLNVTELKKVEVSDTAVTVGAAVSIANLITLLRSHADKAPYFMQVSDHLQKIANVPVRNLGTWAGNVMMSYAHQDFASDVFLLFAASNATLTIGSVHSVTTSKHTVWELLTMDMSTSLILNVELPFLTNTVNFKSYKIMPRAENSVAHASGAFAMTVDSGDSYKVTELPTLVIGGGSTRPMACPKTAQYLMGKSLLDANTLKGTMNSLTQELPASTSTYKKEVVLGLLYKFYLSCIESKCSPSVKSAISMLQRPISSGTQVFTPTPSEFPVGEPINKLAAKLQTSGEAQFTTDIPLIPNELAAAFVLTTKCNVVISKVDTSVAETMPGFVKVLTAQDIPPDGVNNLASPHTTFQPELLFADYMSQYTGQAAAVVLADTRENAEKIAKAVSLEYGEAQGPVVVKTEDALRMNSFFEEPQESITSGDVNTAISKSDMNLRGQIECGSQYHFTMETQTSLVVPNEGETYSVYSATQWVTSVQAAVASVLGLENSSVDVTVKRIGGGYGAKLLRPNAIAAACALGAHSTRRPVRMHMDLETNMKMVGKRYPFLATYQVGFSKEGIVNGIVLNVFGNAGVSTNDNAMSLFLDEIDNTYHVPNWQITIKYCKTNLAISTPCRSPGSIPAVFIIETIMDQVAKTLGMDVEAVKKMNFYKDGEVTPTGLTLKDCHISTLWDSLCQSADVAKRKEEIASFNKANRWMKRGISVVPIKYCVHLKGFPYMVFVSVFAEDGTMAISHGGVEIGQGINTKVTQVAAMTLGIPMERIKIKPCSTLTSPNSIGTGGSTTSELICFGVIKACQAIKDRMKPVKDKNPDMSWGDLVVLCYSQNIDLSAKFWVTDGDADYYFTYGVTATEVELDVLTGQIQIPRVDILYDCGNSMNPKIDVGQVEGAFVMGLGYWLTENVVHDTESGGVTTFNTWTYKPPSSKDIPIDFRVQLLSNSPNPAGVLGSKAVGEPPMCMSCSALFAVKRAIEDARSDAGIKDFFPLSGPAILEAIHSACSVDPQTFYL